MSEVIRTGLETYLSVRLGVPVVVTGVAPISSVGNARDPWAATIDIGGARPERIEAVLLVKAEAGQLETTLGPEFHTLAALDGSDVPAPRALWLDEEGAAFGRPFFATERVAGSADTAPLRRPEDAERMAAVAVQLARAAARLHRVDVGPFEAHLAPTAPASAADAQLAHWAELFERQRLEPHPALAYVIAWLEGRRPVAPRVSVVHGDLRFGNLLHHGDRLTALLDWEMVHLGDPTEDLGWVYRDLWSPAQALPFEAFLDAYEDVAERAVDRVALRWWQVFNEVKHSVISLTATRSFAERTTQALRHANRSATVPGFVRRALELVEDAC